MYLEISQTPSNTPSNTPTNTPSNTQCPGSSPTPTPSPTPIPLICNSFEVYNGESFPVSYEYIDCDLVPQTPTQNPGEYYYFCAIVGTEPESFGSFVVTDLGPCIPVSPTPTNTNTPTNSSTPTNTPTNTPTVTPTSTSAGIPYNYYTLENCTSPGSGVNYRSILSLALNDVYTFLPYPPPRACYRITSIAAPSNTNDLPTLYGPLSGCDDPNCQQL